jgi:hypothetical protein
MSLTLREQYIVVVLGFFVAVVVVEVGEGSEELTKEKVKVGIFYSEFAGSSSQRLRFLQGCLPTLIATLSLT